MTDTRTRFLQIRITEDEQRWLHEQAEAAHQPLSWWVRERLFEGYEEHLQRVERLRELSEKFIEEDGDE